ncbi:glycoside hydrolase family 16 protein [Clostridium cuniculi]|uniref:glycoside hydrolase family 16 protein n=1 Tax=Clostridium cuniculi TaxID=2548455 RepID=UPI0018A894A3|nr:glycoside hydrolase family 16 protein [Clostridium cuniculi]
MRKKVERGIKRKVNTIGSIFLSTSILVGSNMVYSTASIQLVKVEENVVKNIISMDYFSEKDGPVLSATGVGEASYGFVMPIFNGGELSWEEVANDIVLNVKVDDKWVDIGEIDSFSYNYNWGIWSDGGFNGYWFNISETTTIQLVSKSNPSVSLDYTLEFTNLEKQLIASMSATQGPEITAGVTGGAGFTYPTFNGDSSIIYDQVKDDLDVYIWSNNEEKWINLLNNAESGWIYDKNFGTFTDGGGGLWFNVNKTEKVRLISKSSPEVYLDYTIKYEEPVRSNYKLTADITTYTAGDTGAVGIPLPKIDGGFPTAKELDGFVYEIKVNDKWVELSDGGESGFSYQANGYNNLSDRNQWGYWVDNIYGLWFQPIQEDMEIRIGYPTDGVKGNSIEDNYVYYNFIGNPDATRPDVSDLGNINIGTSDNSEIDGWELSWNDEFNGDSLDLNNWNYDTGYFIDDDPDKWGWGNNELEYYTDSEKNIYVKDGNLNITALYEPTTFPEIDPNRVAEYSSGKITTKDKFAFTYGRIDFRAKLPKGSGLWPALWMLPNDDVYGGWASSGEIDVMEARGRLPEASSGAIHFGGGWPSNTNIGGDYYFKDGESIDSDYHVYSAVWEEDNIKWYVDGECFFKATKEQWYSLGNLENDNAPFDQDFYIIMNLAVGGWFDGGVTPNEGDIPATMQVDYVRVYKAED